MSFILRNFVEEPTVSKLEGDLKKQDWRQLAQKYNIVASSSLVKKQLKDVVIKGLVSNQVLSEEAFRLLPQAIRYEKDSSEDDDSEMLKLDQERINLEREKLELKKKELEARERESARELEARERELEDRERELENRERERKKHQLSSKQGRFTVKSSAGILAAPDDEYRTSKAMTSASLPPLSVISCGYCKKTGHHITQCQTPGCRKSFYSGQVKFQSAPPTVSSGTQKVQSSQKPKPNSHITVESLNSHEDIFKDFKSSGEVGLSENGPFDPVTILRDTGAAQSILTKVALPGVEENITKEKVILSDLSSEQSTELAKVFLKCNLFNKEVKVGIREQKMPISGIQLILGNDLAGSMVVPTPEIVKTPCAHSPTLV
ncbi:hypothetical protein Pcinc_000568 [Petrolisthes cinctipes]|uniref:Peptidase A2 domain-containing protein n=1 Tax=Petrolisthes cinctipes TaxID=88211 RepID=A0AAE1L6E2_PETCI|nr:hypothetical protein Pcinc_000568 [Petrolisthes cinctipes]